MADDEKAKQAEADAELEREIRAGRKFTLSEAIGRLAGPGAMKGISPITLKRQAEAVIQEFLREHLSDSGGVLRGLLLRHVVEGETLVDHLDQPLAALAIHVDRILGNDYLLREAVRIADAEWGQVAGERPFFDREGHSPHPDDPYTVESVRAALTRLAETLGGEESNARTV